MAHKTITISENAYELLRREKRSGESFTGVILRLLQKPKLSLLPLKWHGSEHEAEQIFDEIINERKGKSMREVEL